MPLFQENNIPIYEPNLLKEHHFKKATSELYLRKNSKKLYDFTNGDKHLAPIITLLCLLYSHSNENVTLLNIKDINDLIKSIFDYEDIKVKRLMNVVRARTDSNNPPRHFDLLFKYMQQDISEYRKDSNIWSFWDWMEIECNLFDFLENQKALDKKLLIDKLSIELRNPKSLILLESFSDIISLSEIYDFCNIKIKNALDIAKKDLPKLIENI